MLKPDKQLKFNPKRVAKDLYKLRSKIAHELSIGSSTTMSKLFAAHHVAKACSTVIINKILKAY